METNTQSRTDGLVRTIRSIQADANGNLPTRIMLMRCGNWGESIKGNLQITPSDLQEFKQNYDAGIGLPADASVGLPIDFSHNEWDQAAAWIKGLQIEGDALFADPVEWSTAGKEAIMGGMFKCISPSFYPAARGGWADPEDQENVVGNVLTGAGLTNIPFFKGLTAVRASAHKNGADDKNVIYLSESQQIKEKKMTIDAIRIKAATDLTEDEKKFLADHKAELSADELKKFDLEDKQEPDKDKKVAADQLSEDERKMLADIRAGNVQVVAKDKVVVEASTLEGLKETSQQYQHDKALSVVETHAARGAIKADRVEAWTDRLVKASGAERADLEAELKALPDNKQIASEYGNDSHLDADLSPREQIAKLAGAKVAAAAKEGRVLDVAEAQKQVLTENSELAAADREANKIK